MDQTVIVTGGSNGIGRAIMYDLSRNGYRAINLDVKEPMKVLDNEVYLNVDLSDTNSLMDAIEEVKQSYEVLRIVNNVGVVKPALVEEATIEEVRAVNRLTIEVPLILVQAFIPSMKTQKFGRIINISSRAALGKINRTAYSASKAGLLGVTRTWALELAAFGITVNAIGPGAIKTELFAKANPPSSPLTQSILASTPAGRFGEPEEVAHAVSFFLDDKSSFITGQCLFVCGGLSVGFCR